MMQHSGLSYHTDAPEADLLVDARHELELTRAGSSGGQGLACACQLCQLLLLLQFRELPAVHNRVSQPR